MQIAESCCRKRGATDHRRAAADRVRAGPGRGDPDARATGAAGRKPEETLADTLYTGDENVQAAAARGVDLVGPVPGRAPEADAEAMTVDDFGWDARTGAIDTCPAGHRPTSCARAEATARTRIEMPASACCQCPFRKQCPIENTHDGKFTLEFTDKERRLAGRRVENKRRPRCTRSVTRRVPDRVDQ